VAKSSVLSLVLWGLAWEAEVMLASVLGCLECGEELSFTLDAIVLGLGGGSDASFSARLLGMCYSALAYVRSSQCRGDASLGARLLCMQ